MGSPWPQAVHWGIREPFRAREGRGAPRASLASGVRFCSSDSGQEEDLKVVKRSDFSTQPCSLPSGSQNKHIYQRLKKLIFCVRLLRKLGELHNQGRRYTWSLGTRQAPPPRQETAKGRGTGARLGPWGQERVFPA